MSHFCVVIKIYNEYEMLEGCIQSLSCQTRKPKQIIIADNKPPDPNLGKEISQLIKKYSDISNGELRLPLKKRVNLDPHHLLRPIM